MEMRPTSSSSEIAQSCVLGTKSSVTPRPRNEGTAATNPALIVEVLSDSTESADRGDQWAHYQRIPSLGEYVLVSQVAPRVEVYSRDPDHPERWHYQEHGPGATVLLTRLGVTLEVDAIYANPLA